MEPRNPTTRPDARGWKVLATGAALGTLLVLAAPPARAEPIPPNPHAVTKCIVNGITSYSDKPCPNGVGEHRIAVDSAPPVAIVASDATRPPPRVRDARCDAAQAELHNIDALTKQGQPPDMQAFLEARRQQKRNEQFRYRC